MTQNIHFEDPKSRCFFHKGLGEMVYNRTATAEILGCSTFNLSRIRNIVGGLKPLLTRYNREVVYAYTDIQNFLDKRK